jgi:predicted RNA binding protein YcfA (HicA-like mRNA interferase family)
MKVRDVLRRLNSEGWTIGRQKGSHRQFVHPEKKGRVTVADQPNLDLQYDTLKSIYTQAGWGKP